MQADLLLLAHPLTDSVVLPLPPVAIAGLSVLALVAAAGFGAVVREDVRAPLLRTRSGPLGRVEVAGHIAMVALLGLAVLAGRLGPTTTTGNLAPILVVAVGWPALVAGAALLGIWSWVDPFDGLARAARAVDDTGAGEPRTGAADVADGDPLHASPPPVWMAALLMAVVGFYAVGYPEGLRPPQLGLAIAVYTLVTAAGCLALGRRRWLERAEPIGLLLTWIGGLRRRRLAGWDPPSGASAVLGLAAGAAVFGLLRGTSLYVDLAFAVGPRAADVFGPLALGLVGFATLAAADRGRERTAPAAAVPVVAGLLLAHSLRNARLLFGLQLLPGVLVDPLGRGWTIGGFGPGLPRALPLTAAGLAMIQIALVVGGGVLGARLVRRRTAARGVAAPVGAVIVLVIGGVLAVTVA
jgi:hypothetical protein